MRPIPLHRPDVSSPRSGLMIAINLCSAGAGSRKGALTPGCCNLHCQIHGALTPDIWVSGGRTPPVRRGRNVFREQVCAPVRLLSGGRPGRAVRSPDAGGLSPYRHLASATWPGSSQSAAVATPLIKEGVASFCIAGAALACATTMPRL